MSDYDKPKYAIPGLMPAESPNRDARVFTNYKGEIKLEVGRVAEPADPKPVNWRILWPDGSDYCASSDYISYEIEGGDHVTYIDFPAEVLPIGTWTIAAEHDGQQIVVRVTRKPL